MNGGDGSTTRWMYLMSLSYTLYNGKNAKFYVWYILPKFKKINMHQLKQTERYKQWIGIHLEVWNTKGLLTLPSNQNWVLNKTSGKKMSKFTNTFISNSR